MSTQSRLIILILAAGVLVAGAVGFYLYNKPHPDLQRQEADYSLSAAELFAAFEADEQAATAKYVGSGNKEIILEVSGMAQDVKETENGGMTLSLKEPGEMSGVNCEFLEASEVAEGEQITVRGVCTGMLLDVVLSRCTRVE